MTTTGVSKKQFDKALLHVIEQNIPYLLFDYGRKLMIFGSDEQIVVKK